MHELDHHTIRLIVRERQEQIRREMALSRMPRQAGRVRRHVGLWLVGLGVRVAGPPAEQRGLTAPLQPG